MQKEFTGKCEEKGQKSERVLCCEDELSDKMQGRRSFKRSVDDEATEEWNREADKTKLNRAVDSEEAGGNREAHERSHTTTQGVSGGRLFAAGPGRCPSKMPQVPQ